MALRTYSKVRLNCEIEPDFRRIDADAIWEEFSIGAEHLTLWERVATASNGSGVRAGPQLYAAGKVTRLHEQGIGADPGVDEAEG